jgi:hypothetical protein
MIPGGTATDKNAAGSRQMADHATRDAQSRWANPSWWNLLVVLPWTIGVILAVYGWTVDRDIATRQETTQGVITSHEPANHDRYGYVFSVNGKNFSGWGHPRNADQEIGKRVVVYYDPRNPNKSAITDFRELSAGSLGPVPFLLIGIAAVAWFINVQRRKGRTTKATS